MNMIRSFHAQTTDAGIGFTTIDGNTTVARRLQPYSSNCHTTRIAMTIPPFPLVYYHILQQSSCLQLAVLRSQCTLGICSTVEVSRHDDRYPTKLCITTQDDCSRGTAPRLRNTRSSHSDVPESMHLTYGLDPHQLGQFAPTTNPSSGLLNPRIESAPRYPQI
jgi:hypothetical protein